MGETKERSPPRIRNNFQSRSFTRQRSAKGLSLVKSEEVSYFHRPKIGLPVAVVVAAVVAAVVVAAAGLLLDVTFSIFSNQYRFD